MLNQKSMMMKKMIWSVAIACLCTTAASAQSMVRTGNGTTFGIRAGVNFQNINGQNAIGNDLENKIMTGFHAGVNAEIPVGEGFYVQPGLM